MKKTKEENAITLIALVITIIVLLILAGISINTITGDNGILKMTQQAKVENEIATEKEIVIRSANAALMNTKGEEFSLNDLQKELDIEAGNGKTEASDEGNSYDVIFKDTNRLYTVNKEGDVTSQGEISKDSNPGDIKKNQNNEIISLDFNNVKINEIELKISKNIQKNLKKLEENKKNSLTEKYYDDKIDIIYEVPMSIIYDVPILVGIGPKVPFKLDVLGNVKTNVITNIKEYGINNSLVEVILNMKINIQIILPFSSKNIVIESNVPLKTKVIQGKIPTYYGGIISNKTT